MTAPQRAALATAPRSGLDEAGQAARQASQRLDGRFRAEVRLPTDAPGPVREAAYRRWLVERAGMPLAALASAPVRVADLDLIGPQEGLARLCVALRRDDGGPDLVLADPFDRGTRWWLEARIRRAHRPRCRWFVAPHEDLIDYWQRTARELPLWPAPGPDLSGAADAPEAALPCGGPADGTRSPLRELLTDALRDGARRLHLTADHHGLRQRLGFTSGWQARPVNTLRIGEMPGGAALDVLADLHAQVDWHAADPTAGLLPLPFHDRTVCCPVRLLAWQAGERSVVIELAGLATTGSPRPVPLEGTTRSGLVRALGRPFGLLVLASPPDQGKGELLSQCLTSLTSPARHGSMLLVRAANRAGSDTDPALRSAGVTVIDRPALPGTLDAQVQALGPALVALDDVDTPALAAWALQQALSGRNVVLTLAAPHVPGAWERLRHLCGPDSGATLGSVLTGLYAQRLLGTVCRHCLETDDPDDARLRASGLSRDVREEGWAFVRGTGCAACHHTGQDGQVVISQWFDPGQHLRASLGSDAGLDALMQNIAAIGLPSLREAALQQVCDGLVTLEEADRVTAVDE